MIKQWKGKGDDSLRVDLSIILHHIHPLGLIVLPFCFSHFEKKEGREKQGRENR